MKKQKLNISIVAALCVFCTAGTNSFAAGSVRALGGTGTYNGTAAATTANTSTTATRAAVANRAGSLRVSPTTTRSVSTATRTNANGVTAPTERLSIGKYLGGATSISTTGGSGPAASAAEISEINTNINNLFDTTQTIEGDITNLENTKQDKLTAGDYVVINNDEVSVDLAGLEEHLQSSLELPNKVKIQYDSVGDKLQWSEDGGTTWSDLLNISELTGDYVSAAQLEDKIDTLAKYATNDAVQSALDEMSDEINDALETKANASDVYSKSDIDTKLASVATGAAMTEALAEKQPKSTADYALGTGAGGWAILSAEQLNALNSGVTGDTVADVAANKSGVAANAAAIATKANASDVYTKAESNNTFATQAAVNTLSGRVDTNESAIATKANANDVYTKAEVDSAIATGVAGVDLTSFATTDAMNTALATKADTTTVSGLSDELSDLSSDVTTNTGRIADLETSVANIPAQEKADWNATSGAAQILNKPDLSVYATNSDLESGLATKADTSAVEANTVAIEQNTADIATNVVDIATNTAAIATKANSADVTAALATKADKADVTATMATKADKADVATSLAAKADKENTYTKAEVDSAISAGVGDIDLSGYETTEHAADTYQVKGDYLTAHQSLENYPTRDEVYTVAEANASFASKDELNAKANANDVYTKGETDTLLNGKVNTSVIGDLGDNSTVAAAIQSVADQVENMDLSGYVQKSDVESTLSASSENPVQNKVVTGALDEKITRGTVPSTGEYVLGFVGGSGGQTYIKVVDGNGN